jgi:hypothetical protein
MGDGNDKELQALLDDIAEDGSIFQYGDNGTIDTGIDYTPTYSWAYPQQDNIEVPESGDVKIGDRSLKEFMDKVESRLAILTPDSKKLEKFAALRKAYEHYKTLESLCELEEEDDHDGSIDY